jgi:hypothetical protein
MDGHTIGGTDDESEEEGEIAARQGCWQEQYEGCCWL